MTPRPNRCGCRGSKRSIAKTRQGSRRRQRLTRSVQAYASGVIRAPPYAHREVTISFVSELFHMPPETPAKHRHLRGHAEAHRCWEKSLIGSALVGFGVRQHARADSISKRAPSTTRPFVINRLQSHLS